MSGGGTESSSAAALDCDRLVSEACEATGLADFGAEGWREGLERLVASLRDEAALNDVGHLVAGGEIQQYLTNRLRITEWHRVHPEASAIDVSPPIVIIGQGRTGTTILHDMIAQDPANRVPLTWEVDRPLPPPEPATYESDPRIDEVQAQLDMSELVIPGFKAMHPMGARLPQECVRITAADYRSMIFPTQYRAPSYARWLLGEADMGSAYRWHRRYLQVLQWRHRGQRWVLKSPGHLWALGALLAEYPDALLVQTHRDPLRIIASIASLRSTLRRLASDDPSTPADAAEFAEYIVDGLDRSVRDREDGTVPADRVVDVQFADFMADPFATIRAIYARLGLELSADAESRMRAFLADNPQDKHGRHRYSFADSGLDAGEWRDRARRYQQYFDVPSEVV
ncbi:MAG TPA: sulfotransferase [Candidatus Binatia bacterium]|nr:sulfotransferase [Candidatus Binatia bacterium]